MVDSLQQQVRQFQLEFKMLNSMEIDETVIRDNGSTLSFSGITFDNYFFLPKTLSDKVEKIDFSRCNLSEVPGNIHVYQQLRELNLSDNMIQEIPPDLDQVPRIAHLDISGNPISFEKIQGFSNVENLKLSRKPIRNIPMGFEHISELDKIRTLIMPVNVSAHLSVNEGEWFWYIIRQLQQKGCQIKSEGPITITLAAFGGPQVGKTSILRRFAADKTETDWISTIGVDLLMKHQLYRGQEFKFMMFNQSQQPLRFRPVWKSYFRILTAVLLVFDLSDPQSLDEILGLPAEILRDSGWNRIPFVIVGNKQDLAPGAFDREEEVQLFIKSLKDRTGYEIPYLKISTIATDNEVNQIFEQLSQLVLQRSLPRSDK